MTLHFTSRSGPGKAKLAMITRMEHLSWVENKCAEQIALEIGWTREKTLRWLSENGIVGHYKPYKVPRVLEQVDFTNENIEVGRL